MIRPTRLLISLTIGSLAVALLPVLISPTLWVIWLGYIITILLLVLLELFEVTAKANHTKVIYDLPQMLYIGLEDELRLKVKKGPQWAGFIGTIHADFNEILGKHNNSVHFSDSTDSELSIPLLPLRRGPAVVETLWITTQSRFRLIERIEKMDCNKTVPVVSDFKSLKRLAIEFFGSREITSGIKIEKYIGEGSEFDRLKEFLPGMDHRTIDWKASARHCKLLNREYRAERNHQILLAYDTGYLMSEPINGIPKLDHAINNSLFLAYVSLQVGDRVGLLSFDEKVQTFWEPRGGLQHFPAFKASTGKVNYTTKDTNFTRSFAELTYRLHSRALIIVFTDFIDSISAELMVENLTRLARKHLIMCISMRDTKVEEMINLSPSGVHAISQSVVTYEMEIEREIVLNKLRKKGILVIDVEPQKLTGEIINSYLDIKRREMIS